MKPFNSAKGAKVRPIRVKVKKCLNSTYQGSCRELQRKGMYLKILFAQFSEIGLRISKEFSRKTFTMFWNYLVMSAVFLKTTMTKLTLWFIQIITIYVFHCQCWCQCHCIHKSPGSLDDTLLCSKVSLALAILCLWFLRIIVAQLYWL